MQKHKKGDFAPHIPPDKAPPCYSEGCKEPGAYKAPKSPEALHDYQWYCLDHIRERNQKWNYFSDMDSNQIEEFIKDAVTGHRPTWNRENGGRQQYTKLHDALYEFLHMGAAPAAKPEAPVSSKLRKALAAMNMSYPYNEDELKTQYRILVKKHHPDVNKGDKQSEETFKQVAIAYQMLQEHLKNM